MTYTRKYVGVYNGKFGILSKKMELKEGAQTPEVTGKRFNQKPPRAPNFLLGSISPYNNPVSP
jgi:hypothetical protein